MEDVFKFQSIKNRPINYVNLVLSVESGCNPKEGEYSLHITGFIGSLDISDDVNGTDDFSLIMDCLDNTELDYPKNGELHIILRESGEWEDVFWHKYYEVERICKIEY